MDRRQLKKDENLFQMFLRFLDVDCCEQENKVRTTLKAQEVREDQEKSENKFKHARWHSSRDVVLGSLFGAGSVWQARNFRQIKISEDGEQSPVWQEGQKWPFWVTVLSLFPKIVTELRKKGQMVTLMRWPNKSHSLLLEPTVCFYFIFSNTWSKACIGVDFLLPPPRFSF